MARLDVRAPKVNQKVKLKQIGTLNLTTKFDDLGWITCKFFVCDKDGPAILSCDASEKLGILRISNSKNISAMKRTTPDPHIPDVMTLQKLYPDQFKGLQDAVCQTSEIHCK
ncbi:hypothetical protein CAPTEDRAFT_208740 [Capitella teleta]|uniref:Uncharacterized protein n=1 Tax=Capitella teleta TaxID=283909 RepID=R7UMS8_CAPTE|nr:hypothetical protein CAPTEDRAFT_208740 [Capitella teleta]|eukprot:ELU07520.1 hypothetical protein CAPTEDRAFT_208740 [Capitella teleta]